MGGALAGVVVALLMPKQRESDLGKAQTEKKNEACGREADLESWALGGVAGTGSASALSGFSTLG